jgi:hypothetical protein
MSEQEVVGDNFPIKVPISDNFYQAKATLVGSNFSNQIQSEILGKFKSWESGCNFSLNQVNTWYHWSGCWGDQWVGTANGSHAIWNMIWGILKGEFDQIASILNVDWGALVQNLSNVLSSIKGLVQQVVDLIKNPTILLDLAVAKLDDFNNTEFYQKFYKLGVFISQFTSGVVIIGIAEKSISTIKNIFSTGKLVEKVSVINSQTNNINIAERIYTDAEKYKTLDNQGRAWMPLQDGLWVPQKKLGNKFMVNGADVNWHLQNGNFTQSNFDKLLLSAENDIQKQGLRNRRKCIPCVGKFVYLGKQNFFATLFNPINVQAASDDCSLPYVTENRVPKDSETFIKSTNASKTNIRVQGATVYKDSSGNYLHRDKFHTGVNAEVEVYNSQGKHIGSKTPDGTDKGGPVAGRSINIS